MDELCTNSTIILTVTTIPNIFEVKKSEKLAFGDFSQLKRERRVSLESNEFLTGNYSYSVLSAERNKEIVPMSILHQDNIDPCLLVKSWLDSSQLWWRSCDYQIADNPIKDIPSGQQTTRTRGGFGKEITLPEISLTELEEVVAARFDGLFCFVKHSKFLSDKASVSKLPLSQKGLYKVECDNKTIGIAIDPTDVFGDAELSSTLLYDSRYSRRCSNYAVALHKTVSELHVSGSIPIGSVLYGTLYRSFCTDGNHIENPYYCFDATVDGADFSTLPDTVFVKILLYVPWRQRILSRRVNKRWMNLCNVAISIDTKIIRRCDEQSYHMDTDDLWRLMPIVCGCLEEIEWRDLCRSQCLPEMLQQIPAFPNLRIIDMGDEIPDYVIFFSLLDKCPNLRELRARIPSALSTDYSPGTFQVEKLIVPIQPYYNVQLDGPCLTEIINRFPRLSYLRCEGSYITAGGLSVVIGKYGENLAHLQMNCCNPYMLKLQSNGDVTGMEQCRNLEYLELRYADFLSDAFMNDMANGCHKLRTLDISRCDNVTNEGLTALASLPNLKRLNISNTVKNLSSGISQIAKQGHLEQLIAHSVDLSPTCLKACVRYCRRLKLLDVTWCSLDNDFALEDAKEIIHLFNGWSLSSCLLFRTDCEIWTNSEVKQLLKEQMENGQRRFVVHFVRAYSSAGDFIQEDDESVSSHGD